MLSLMILLGEISRLADEQQWQRSDVGVSMAGLAVIAHNAAEALQAKSAAAAATAQPRRAAVGGGMGAGAK